MRFEILCVNRFWGIFIRRDGKDSIGRREY